jgi:hypothetical protein
MKCYLCNTEMTPHPMAKDAVGCNNRDCLLWFARIPGDAYKKLLEKLENTRAARAKWLREILTHPGDGSLCGLEYLQTIRRAADLLDTPDHELAKGASVGLKQLHSRLMFHLGRT